MARSSSCFRSLVLFLLEHFLLPLVEINFSVKYGLLKFKNCRASRSFVLYTPQKTLWHFFMFFFLLDSLCFITMCFPGTQLLTSYFENHVIIHVGQAGFIVAWAREFTKIITPWALTVTLRTLTWNYEIGKARQRLWFSQVLEAQIFRALLKGQVNKIFTECFNNIFASHKVSLNFIEGFR